MCQNHSQQLATVLVCMQQLCHLHKQCTQSMLPHNSWEVNKSGQSSLKGWLGLLQDYSLVKCSCIPIPTQTILVCFTYYSTIRSEVVQAPLSVCVFVLMILLFTSR